MNGERLNLYEVDGRIILVNFWATWCSPCIQELPQLQSLYDTLKERGFQVVGVAVDDTQENVREAAQSYGIKFPLLIDNSGTSKRRFELRGFPESFVLDAQHRILVIPDPQDGMPVSKVVGPRDWSSESVVKLFSDLLKQQQVQAVTQ